ncbi:DUF3592 domain-containing protein, partial [Eubacteriales bacterium OttesenSCG-928-A19]|nr:DUF3592 domain-containing protein [Eubacteriales bacterium OttesenSCG-928-A19]
MILAAVFTAVSVALLAVGGIVYAGDAAWRRDALPVEAVITSTLGGRNSARHMVAYEVDGVEYTGVLSYDETGLYEGRTVTLHVNPENPAEFRDGGAGIAAMVLGIIGAAFLIPAVILWIAALGQSRRAAALRRDGTEITAEVLGAQPTSMVVNGARTYVVQCQWMNPQDDTTYIFRSPRLTYDPTALLRERGIARLPVLIDPHNPKRYYVVLDAVEEKVVVL